MGLPWKGLAVSGRPGSGKDSIVDGIQPILEKSYGWGIKYSVGAYWREKHKEAERAKLTDLEFKPWWDLRTAEENLQVNLELIKKVETGEVGTVVSRYIHFYPESLLRVFVTADLDVRSQRAFANPELYPGKTLNEIKDWLVGREADELAAGREEEMWGEHYDFRDPRFYHAVIDTTNLTVQEGIDALMGYLKGDLRVQNPNPLVYDIRHKFTGPIV